MFSASDFLTSNVANFLADWVGGDQGFQFGLFTNDIQPTPFTGFDDLVEATFPDYDRIDATPVVGRNPASGDYVVAPEENLQWVRGSGTNDPETIRGWFAANTDSQLLFSNVFDPPVNMAIQGDLIQIENGEMRIPLDAVKGGVVNNE